MRVLTDYGAEVIILPDCAKCIASDGNKHPFDLDECPLNNEDECRSDYCPYYVEDWKGEWDNELQEDDGRCEVPCAE